MPDQDFLARIQAAELEAEQLVAQAVDQGRIRQEQARQTAHETIVACRNEADQIVQTRVATARDAADELLVQSKNQAQVSTSAIRQDAQNTLAAAISAVRERIVTSSVRR